MLQEFLTEADRFGYICVFYQIESKWMSLYHDFGYNFFKLGEEAVVDLNTFTITGKKRAGMRATFNRFEREGYTFSIHEPPFSDELYEELKKVSDAWLGGKKRRDFHLGTSIVSILVVPLSLHYLMQKEKLLHSQPLCQYIKVAYYLLI